MPFKNKPVIGKRFKKSVFGPIFAHLCKENFCCQIVRVSKFEKINFFMNGPINGKNNVNEDLYDLKWIGAVLVTLATVACLPKKSPLRMCKLLRDTL